MSILLVIIGLSCGLAVASGIFALITILGIIPRMTDRFGLASHTYQMEDMIVFGGTAGCIVSIYKPEIPLGSIFLILFGVFAGIYVGAFAMALAETLKVVPILCQRVGFHTGIAILILMIALGKALGALYQLYILGSG